MPLISLYVANVSCSESGDEQPCQRPRSLLLSEMENKCRNIKWTIKHREDKWNKGSQSACGTARAWKTDEDIKTWASRTAGTNIAFSPRQFHSNWFWWSFSVREFTMIIILPLLLEEAIHYCPEWNACNISSRCLFPHFFFLSSSTVPYHAELLSQSHKRNNTACTSQESNLYLSEFAIKTTEECESFIKISASAVDEYSAVPSNAITLPKREPYSTHTIFNKMIIAWLL